MAHPTKAFLSSTLLAAAVSLASVGCGPIAPVSPSWKNDVRPLIVSRCLRCHDGSGKGDPSVTGSTAGHGFNFNVPPELPSPLPPGLMSLQNFGPKAVRGEGFPRRMPPPPLEALQDWQIDIIDGWAITPLP
jgi:hypothetical protein